MKEVNWSLEKKKNRIVIIISINICLFEYRGHFDVFFSIEDVIWISDRSNENYNENGSIEWTCLSHQRFQEVRIDFVRGNGQLYDSI